MRKVVLPWRELAEAESAYGGGASQLGDSQLRRQVIESLGERWPAIERRIAQCAELGVGWVPGPDDGDLAFIDAEIRAARKLQLVAELAARTCP